jgi:propanol-preferring alcohol dehydrogenase
MAAREARIQASAVGTREDLREVLALAAQGKIRCEVAARPLSQINEILDQMRRGEISGRIAVTPH